MPERVADLHRQIYYLEQQVNEQKRHLDEKEHIIYAQVAMISKLRQRIAELEAQLEKSK